MPTRTNLLGNISGGAIGTASYTTPSGTTRSGEVLWVIGVANSGTSITATNLTISDSQGNTYTSQFTFSASPGANMAFRVWSAYCPTGAAGVTWTIDCGADSTDTYAVFVFSYAGASQTIGATGSNGSAGTDGATSLTLGSAPLASSEVIGLLQVDYAAGGGDSIVQGSAFTEQYDIFLDGHAGEEVETRTNSTSTTVDWQDVSVTGGGRVGDSAAIGFEIQEANATPPGIQWVREVGTPVANTTGAASTAFTVGAAGCQVGDLLVAAVSVDNSGSSGAEPGLTVTDTGGNTWQTRNVSLNDPGAANAGCAAYIADCIVTTALVSGNTITFTWGTGSPPAKAITVDEFRGVQEGPAGTRLAVQNASQGSTTTTGVSATPTAKGQLVFAVHGGENGTADSYTNDSDTTDGSWTATSRVGAGTTTSGQTVQGAWKIVTGVSTQTFNPTIGTARDWAEKICIYEASRGLPFPPTRPRLRSR